MKKSIKKWIVSGAIIVVIGGGFGSYFYFTNDDTQQVAAQATTQTATAELGDVEIYVSGTGSISTINKETATSTGNATIDEVNVEEGDSVSMGTEVLSVTDCDNLEMIVNKAAEHGGGPPRFQQL